MLIKKTSFRFSLYLSLFAILLIIICPTITQTIALISQSSVKDAHHFTPPALSHFECASQFIKDNHLDPDMFEDPEPLNLSASHDNVDEHPMGKADHGSIVSCGYCDLIHSATILVAFYSLFLDNSPHQNVILTTTNPLVSSLNFWSILTRAPPANQFIG